MLRDLGSLEAILSDLPQDTIDRIAVAAASAGLCPTEMLRSAEFILRTLAVAEESRFGETGVNPADELRLMLAYGEDITAQRAFPTDRPDAMRALHALVYLGRTVQMEACRIIDRYDQATRLDAAEAAVA